MGLANPFQTRPLDVPKPKAYASIKRLLQLVYARSVEVLNCIAAIEGALRTEKIAAILIGYGVTPDRINHRMEPISTTLPPLTLTALRRVVITVSP